MKKTFEKLYHDLEMSHWWFVARRHRIFDHLSKVPKGADVLDIGCSSGILLKHLTLRGYNASGIDISEEAIENSKGWGVKAFVWDGTYLPPAPLWDCLIASDCLEHIEKDEIALTSWYCALKPGGKLLIYVPAFQYLWSEHDVVNQHYRRYTRKELVQKVEKAGFKVENSGYWNHFLLIPATILRGILRRKSGSGDLKEPNAIVNGILFWLLRVETKLNLHRLPGISAWVEATR